MVRTISTCKRDLLIGRKTDGLTLPRIVGKGNHSPHHIQKIKPRVERVCRELGLQYKTEENEGRIYVNLTGGSANIPPEHHAGGHQQQNAQQDQVEDFVVDKVLPRVFRKLEKACCVVM